MTHPATIHIPLALAVLFPLMLLAFLTSAKRRSFLLQNWNLLRWTVGLQTGATALSLLTGEWSMVLSSADPTLLQSHRVFAYIFFALWLFIFAFCFFTPSKSKWALIVLALVQMAVGVWLGHLGGLIVFG